MSMEELTIWNLPITVTSRSRDKSSALGEGGEVLTSLAFSHKVGFPGIMIQVLAVSEEKKEQFFSIRNDHSNPVI